MQRSGLLSAITALLLAINLVSANDARAEYEDEDLDTVETAKPRKKKVAEDPLPQDPDETDVKKHPKRRRRHYLTEGHEDRIDAGVFHVAAAVGGNFYSEPIVNSSLTPTGDYSKDFGFQAGAYFDYNYNELDDNIPLALRGFLGYKYILSSVHVFTFDGMVRRMMNLSERVTFGLGFGGSVAVWYRTIKPGISTREQIVFLPSLVLGAGFEFTPFIIDFKWLINQIGDNATRMGVELYFGFRL
jgi:hypothetical protein